MTVAVDDCHSKLPSQRMTVVTTFRWASTIKFIYCDGYPMRRSSPATAIYCDSMAMAAKWFHKLKILHGPGYSGWRCRKHLYPLQVTAVRLEHVCENSCPSQRGPAPKSNRERGAWTEQRSTVNRYSTCCLIAQAPDWQSN